MDKQSNSTTAPEISTLIMGTDRQEILHRLTVEELRTLSMKELRALMALLFAVDEATCAFLNQSRFANGTTYGTYNAAGEIGDNLLSHLNECIALVEQVTKDAAPVTADEAADRAWLLIERAAHYSENLSTFITAAAQLSVSALEVEGV